MEHKQLPKRAAKIVEINPTHPVIQTLSRQLASGTRDATFDDAMFLLYDQALIAEGEPIADASAFARRLGALMKKGLAA